MTFEVIILLEVICEFQRMEDSSFKINPIEVSNFDVNLVYVILFEISLFEVNPLF